MTINKKNKNYIFYLYMAFVFLSNFNILSQFLSTFLSSLGFSILTISSLFLVWQVSKFILEIPTGFIADKFGRKTSSILGILILILANMAYLTKNIYIFYIIFFARALAYTLISGSIESIYVESVDEGNLVHYNAIERLVFYVSLALSALMGGYLIDKMGYEAIIFIDIAIMIMSLIVALLFNEDRTYTKESIKSVNMKECLSIIKSNKVLLYLYTIDLATAFSFIAVENLYPIYLEELGVEIHIVGIFISFQLIFSAIIGLFLPRIREKINDKILLYLFPFLRVLVVLPIYIFEIKIEIIPVLFALSSLLFVLYAPIKYGIFQNNIASKYRTTFISMQSQAVALGGLLYYSFSSLLSIKLSLNTIISFALIITFIANFYSCKGLRKEKVV